MCQITYKCNEITRINKLLHYVVTCIQASHRVLFSINDVVTDLCIGASLLFPVVSCLQETSYLRHLNISHNEFREEGGIKLGNGLGKHNQK